MSDQDPYGDPTRVDLPPVDATQAMPTTPGAPPPTTPPPTAPPPDEGPDRPRWILIALLVAVALIALAAFLLGGDDDEATGDTTTSTTTAEDTTTTEATTTSSTTTTAEATTTTAAPPATVDPARCVSSAPDDPDTTALVVFDAWGLGDEACAANLMTSDALDDMFALGDPVGMTFAGCVAQEDPDPNTLCAFTYEGGATDFRMSYSETEGWTVFEVFQVAD